MDLELEGEFQGGLLLFYSRRLYCGMGHDGSRMTTYSTGQTTYQREPAPVVRRIHLRIINDGNIATMYYSADGDRWQRHGARMEVSGYNHNTADEFLSLRPALFAIGPGTVRFRQFRYRAIA
ncbi:MAG: hypothetical protein ACEQSK_12400 [Sphingomonadaceae bacterium]